MLVIPIELVGFECFKLDGEVAKTLKPQFPEIIATDPDIEIFAPIVLDPFVRDRAAGLEVLDAIRPRSERRLERGRDYVTPLRLGGLPPMFGQDGELAHDLRQFTI